MTGWLPGCQQELRRAINLMAAVHDAEHDLFCTICDLMAIAPLDDATRKYLRDLRDEAQDNAHRARRQKEDLKDLLDEVTA